MVPVINKEILELIKGSSSKDFNCLLITTTNPEIFENDNNNILKIISKNFFMNKIIFNLCLLIIFSTIGRIILIGIKFVLNLCAELIEPGIHKENNCKLLK